MTASNWADHLFGFYDYLEKSYMKNRFIKHSLLALLGLASVLALDGRIFAGEVSPVQSNARPYGLEVAGLVQLAGSDAAAADFMSNVFPNVQAVMSQDLSAGVNLPNVSTVSIDPSALTLQNSADVRAYFVGEETGFHNSLGFMTTPYNPSEGINSTDAKLIFPDASLPSSYFTANGAGRNRRETAPLWEGDFVDLGTLDAGTSINPFVVSDGANNQTNGDIFTAFTNQNADGLQHFVALAIEGTSYLLIGVEDAYGGDQDYNDVVFALDIGADNVTYLASQAVPLPPAALALIAPAFAFAFRRKRAKSHASGWAS